MADDRTHHWLGLNWQLAPNSGWGILGFNLALQAEAGGRMAPVPFFPTIYRDHFPPQHRALLERIFHREKTIRKILESASSTQGRFSCEFPVLHSQGNWFGWGVPDPETERVRGTANLAIIFLEDTLVNEHARTKSKTFDRILAGSTWNKQVLQRNGIANVEAFLQGVDLSLFRPVKRDPRPGAPFVIFSGGKLEFRKGQDLVIAAFREFRRRCPQALLMFAWHNPWPKSVEGIAQGGHVTGFPAADPQGRADHLAWLEINGVPRPSCRDVGPVPNHLMPQVYANIDVALFPNRCEGGTNLVAMECLASGVPTILSANTGHLDLIGDSHCYALTRQSKVSPMPPYRQTEEWGESDVSEIVERLEMVYRDRPQAQQRAQAAVRFMQDWSWEKRYQELIGHLKDFGCPA